MTKDVADYLATRFTISTRLIADIPWQLHEQRFDAGQIAIAWICGTPYVWKGETDSCLYSFCWMGEDRIRIYCSCEICLERIGQPLDIS
jgi:hypothetical protein